MKTIPNSYPILREAKVVNTTDPEKLGRIQLRVYPELSSIEPENDLPWCFPMSGGTHGKSFSTPLVGQIVWCVVMSRYWNEITFLPFNITKPTEHLFDDWMSKQRPAVTDMKTDPEEEHLIVEQFEDDFTVFHDTKNNQHGYLHPTGTFFVINQDGSIWVQSVKKYTFHNKESDLFFEADSDTGNITLKTKGSVDETVDKDVTKTFKANEKVDVTGNSKHTSANTDIESKAPIGVKGTETQLGSGSLQPYWDSETGAWSQWPMFIPPSPWPSGVPVPPAPPLINMALNGLKAAILQADIAAKASCAKAIK